MEKYLIKAIVANPHLSIVDEHGTIVIWDKNYVTDDNVRRVVNDGKVDVKYSPKKGKTEIFKGIPVTFEKVVKQWGEERVAKAAIRRHLNRELNKIRVNFRK